MRLLSTVAWAKRGASRQDRAHAWLHRVAVGLGLARARLPLAVALSLAFAPDHPLDEIEREKGVVRQEIGEAADQPDDLVFELAQVASYPDHPLGRPILGTEQTLDTIGRDDLVGFASDNYSPQRTVVSVAGAFDRDAILTLVDRWLAGRAGRAAPSCSPSPTTSTLAIRRSLRSWARSSPSPCSAT